MLSLQRLVPRSDGCNDDAEVGKFAAEAATHGMHLREPSRWKHLKYVDTVPAHHPPTPFPPSSSQAAAREHRRLLCPTWLGVV